jgi:hypothetical protein
LDVGDSSSAGVVALSMIGAALGARSAPGAECCFDQSPRPSRWQAVAACLTAGDCMSIVVGIAKNTPLRPSTPL